VSFLAVAAKIYLRIMESQPDNKEAFNGFDKETSMNPLFKEYARQVEDFKRLYDDEDF
jgi:hypothetical protein